MEISEAEILLEQSELELKNAQDTYTLGLYPYDDSECRKADQRVKEWQNKLQSLIELEDNGIIFNWLNERN